MNALLVRDAASRLGVCTERVFGLSFEYAEEPQSRKWIMNQYLRWYHEGWIHPTVQDFVIDVMAGRVQRTEIRRTR